MVRIWLATSSASGDFRQADAACFAPASDQNLGFNDNAATEFLRNVLGFFCGGRYPSFRDRDAVL
jgi:hypothetical protein